MDREKFLNEILQYEGEECITIETNEDSYTIEDGSCFIGGFEGTYMSELLGNVYYEDLKSIADVMYSYITSELNESIEEVNPF